MSLICHESKKSIAFGDPLFAGTREDVNFFSALCDDIIGKIPEEERDKKPCNPSDGGVDIHQASSEKNFNEAYSLKGFTLESFLFSISQETAEKYLPKFIKMFDENDIN